MGGGWEGETGMGGMVVLLLWDLWGVWGLSRDGWLDMMNEASLLS